jgi:1,4-alpha-glucan branching enzyme
MSSRSPKWVIPALHALTIAIALIIFGMLIDTFVANATNRTQNVGASIIGVFGALVLAFLALASPGALEELSFGPFKARWRISQIESRVESIQMAVVGLLNRHERSHLRKLAGEHDDLVEPNRDMFKQLKRLQELGYLNPRFGQPDLSELEEKMRYSKYFRLRDYLEITKMGEEYLRLYRESTLPIKVSSTGEVKIGGKSYGKAENWQGIVDAALDAGWIKGPDYEDVTWAPGVPESLKPKG